MQGVRNGFTLIELMIAIVLLAVGLMVLQSLGVSAAKSVWLADRTTRSSTLAAEWLEDGLQLLRQGRRPPVFSCTLANGDRIQRTLDTTDPNLPRLTVTTVPEARGGTERPNALSSSIFLPVSNLAAVNVPRTPCP
jgi:prepilin-type N-terminal cleavage/methylation domain-containing protein